MSRETRRARNQLLLRAANDRIADMSLQREADGVWLTFACECSRLRCGSRVVAPLGVYAAVAAHTSIFLVRAGHEDDEHEAVTLGHADYRIIERQHARTNRITPVGASVLEHHQAVAVPDAPSDATD